ncbi:MAG TPA: hypothetical protein P5560_07050 [Thermotogota bacterium]|nr:hypothetical protein [Thermotogota bacterium]
MQHFPALRAGWILVVLCAFVALAWADSVPLLYVNELLDQSRLEIFFPDTNTIVPITEGFSHISFPVVCQETGLIGFTHHAPSGEVEVYLIQPDSVEPKKALDKAILQDISSDGRYFLVTGDSSRPSLYRVDMQQGKVIPLVQEKGVTSACFSPDGQMIVFSVLEASGKQDLYRYSPGPDVLERLTQTDSWDEFFPFYTLDGKTLLFMTDRTGKWGVDFFKLDTAKRYQSRMWGMFPRLSPDNALVALEEDGSIVVSDTDGENQWEPIRGSNPAWIPSKAAARFLQKEGESDSPTNCWVWTGESYSTLLGDFLDPVKGTAPSASFSDGCFVYAVELGSNNARTDVSFDPSGGDCPDYVQSSGVARFVYSWDTLPRVLVPGETLEVFVSMKDDGCSARAGSRFLCNLEFAVSLQDRQQGGYSDEEWFSFEAGGFLGTSSWKAELAETVVFTVPYPDGPTRLTPERYPLLLRVDVRTNLGSGTLGSVVNFYEFVPEEE